MLLGQQLTLAGREVYFIDNLKTEQLSTVRCYSLCFLALVSKFRGAAGCPVLSFALC